jgi:hypothetical protein
MYIFKKLFLLVCLTLSFCVPNAFADKVTDCAINDAVYAAFDKQVNYGEIRGILRSLKPDVKALIAPQADKAYKNLNEALKKLNPDESNLTVVAAQLNAVIKYLPPASQKLINNKFPILSKF